MTFCQRRGDRDFFMREIFKFYGKSVKSEPIETERQRPFRRVKRIAYHRITNGFQMNTDLVRSASFWSDFQKRKSGILSANEANAFFHHKMGNSIANFAFFAPLGAALAKISFTPANGLINNSPIIFHLTPNESIVDLGNFSVLKLLFEPKISWLIFSDNQNAGSASIQTMDNAWPWNSFQLTAFQKIHRYLLFGDIYPESNRQESVRHSYHRYAPPTPPAYSPPANHYPHTKFLFSYL